MQTIQERPPYTCYSCCEQKEVEGVEQLKPSTKPKEP